VSQIIGEPTEIPVFKRNYNYEPHPAQSLFHSSDARFRVLICGRKLGKTEMLINEFMRYAGVPDSVLWWLSPQYSISKIAWDRFHKYINPEIIKRVSIRDYEVELINGTRIAFKSGESGKGLVGEGVDFVAVDESARLKESIWRRDVRPNLGDQDRIGDACLASTPLGLNWIYHEWRKGLSHDFPEYESWAYKFLQMPITGEIVEPYDGGFPSWVNPYWPRRELNEVLYIPRTIFLEEYGGRFLDTLSYIFTSVDNVVQDGRFGRQLIERFPQRKLGVKYYVGFDVARSGAGDNAVISIIDEDYTLVNMSVMRGWGYQRQMDEAKAIAEDYNNATICVDSTGPQGDPIAELLSDSYPNVVPYHYTSSRKRELMDNLSVLINTGKLRIPCDEYEAQELVKEMRVFGAEHDKNGDVKYQAAPGFKDDRVNSVALACWLLKEEADNWKLEFVLWS